VIAQNHIPQLNILRDCEKNLLINKSSILFFGLEIDLYRTQIHNEIEKFCKCNSINKFSCVIKKSEINELLQLFVVSNFPKLQYPHGIEEILVVDKDGTLIQYISEIERDVKKERIAMLLTLLQDFIKKVFMKTKEAYSGKLIHGDYNIFIEQAGSVFLVAITKIDTQELKNDLSSIASIITTVDKNNKQLLKNIIKQLFEKKYVLYMDKEKSYELLLNSLLTYAKDQPVIIILEKFELANKLTLECINYLARNISELPILICCIYDTEKITQELSTLITKITRERLGFNIKLNTKTTLSRYYGYKIFGNCLVIRIPRISVRESIPEDIIAMRKIVPKLDVSKLKTYIQAVYIVTDNDYVIIKFKTFLDKMTGIEPFGIATSAMLNVVEKFGKSGIKY